jgi:hypothetical protein
MPRSDAGSAAYLNIEDKKRSSMRILEEYGDVNLVPLAVVGV